ncbi:hypothetical protein SRHO_G00266260 [Serrasalmus rhombeus]
MCEQQVVAFRKNSHFRRASVSAALPLQQYAICARLVPPRFALTDSGAGHELTPRPEGWKLPAFLSLDAVTANKTAPRDGSGSPAARRGLCSGCGALKWAVLSRDGGACSKRASGAVLRSNLFPCARKRSEGGEKDGKNRTESPRILHTRTFYGGGEMLGAV